MTDRLTEIRARMEAWPDVELLTHARADIAWLLDRVQEQEEHLRAISADLADADSRSQ